MNEVTTLLSGIQQGDPHAADQLFPLVYEELRKLAAQKLAQETPGQTLQATALVHEACLQLLTPEVLGAARSRAHFFAAAARAMRHVLVDHARRRAAGKRGGGQETLALDQVLDHFAKHHLDLLAVHDALGELTHLHERQGQVIELRYFGDLSYDEIAAELRLNPKTVSSRLSKCLDRLLVIAKEIFPPENRLPSNL